MIRRFFYTLKQAFQQVFRNKAMTLASMFAITAMLLILGLFFIILVNVNTAAQAVENDYDTIEVYLLDKTTEAEANAIIADLKDFDGVSDIVYRSKDEAMDILKERWGKSSYLLDSLRENPLPNSIVITIGDLDKAEAVAEKAGTYSGVEDVKYYKETVDKLRKATNFIQMAAIIIMVFLIIISLVVVSNTIKLTVFARSSEISIMKYVGATNWFIRGPFLVEGMIIGLVSAAISAGLTALVYSKVIDIIGKDVVNIMSTPMAPVGFMTVNLIWIFVALGVSIGACGSIISMRRFLDT